MVPYSVASSVCSLVSTCHSCSSLWVPGWMNSKWPCWIRATLLWHSVQTTPPSQALFFLTEDFLKEFTLLYLRASCGWVRKEFFFFSIISLITDNGHLSIFTSYAAVNVLMFFSLSDYILFHVFMLHFGLAVSLKTLLKATSNKHATAYMLCCAEIFSAKQFIYFEFNLTQINQDVEYSQIFFFSECNMNWTCSSIPFISFSPSKLHESLLSAYPMTFCFSIQ